MGPKLALNCCSTSGNPDKERKTRATIFGGGSVEFSTIFQVRKPIFILYNFH